MTEEQKKLLDSLQTEFDTLWNKFCDFFPEIQSMFSHKELTKMRGKYAAKYKALCDSKQEIVTSSCLFDEFISSFGNGNQAKDFKDLVKGVGDVIEIAQEHATKNRNRSVFTKIQQTIKDMIVTMDESPLSNNSDYRNRLNELLVFNRLSECENLEITDVAYPLGNNKDCDFRCFHNDGTELLVEVVSIQSINLSKQDNADTFSEFIATKVKKKYADKVTGLEQQPNLKILPIIDYVVGLIEFAPTLDYNISWPPFTTVKNVTNWKIEILLTTIEYLKSKVK